MNKINKIIKAFFILLKRPSLINLVISNDYVWNDYLIKKHHSKKALPLVEMDVLLNKSDYKLHLFSFLGGGSLPTDIILLKELSNQIDKCSYFEIGTWRGESVVNVAETATTCYTLNLPKEKILSSNDSKNYADQHGMFSKNKSNITHLYGDSMSYDYASIGKKFDLIFIDGNHKYPYVKNDTEKIFKHLVHDETIVVWHDYAYNPETIRPEVLSAILDGIPEKYKNDLYHVSNTMCAIYYNKKIAHAAFEYPIDPKMVFEVDLRSKKL